MLYDSFLSNGTGCVDKVNVVNVFGLVGMLLSLDVFLKIQECIINIELQLFCKHKFPIVVRHSCDILIDVL